MKSIDLVIIPPPPVIELSCKISKNLSHSKNIRLNAIDQIPHISLLMGVAHEETLKEIWGSALAISADLQPFTISIDEIRIKKSYSGLHINKSNELAKLQIKLIESIAPLLTHNSSINDFAGEYIAEKSTAWVNKYIENSSGDNFDPHITLGDGKLNDLSTIELPISFTAETFALCHLGNYCTCHTVLQKTKLSEY
jgi:2'-5' RNA ligase